MVSSTSSSSSSSSNTSLVRGEFLKIAGGALAGAAAAVLLAHLWQPAVCHQHGQTRPKASHPRVHVLLVDLEFATKQDREKFADWWTGLAERVYKNEPRCLSYEFSADLEDDTKAIIYERYATKEDLDGPHQESIASHVAEFGTSGAEIVSKVLRSFTESNIGFMDR